MSASHTIASAAPFFARIYEFAMDTLHKAGLRTFTLQKWRVNEGRVTITVDFSDQTMKLD